MLYEIINPSDPYTLHADDLEVAAIVASLIGEGQYALEPQEPDGVKVPLFSWAALTGGSESSFSGRSRKAWIMSLPRNAQR